MNEETKFNIGDQVEWCGLPGVVARYDWDEAEPVVVYFSGSGEYMFTVDGKFISEHTEPSLKLISKAKKKRKVKLYAYLEEKVFDGGPYNLAYSVIDSFVIDMVRIPELDKEVEIDE